MGCLIVSQQAVLPAAGNAKQGFLLRSNVRLGLQVHSLVFANSGTLLLCLLDPSRTMAGFRQRIRSAFPGAV